MSRYLTSGKIALLALVLLYIEGRFPNDAVFPVITFVIKHLVSPKEHGSFVITIEELRIATAATESQIVGRTIFDLLLTKLWEIDSYDALHSFFADITQHFADGDLATRNTVLRKPGAPCQLSRTSILGCFVRRAALEYARLQFHDTVSLWKSFVNFREPTLAAYKKRNTLANQTSFDVNLKKLSLSDVLVNKVYGQAGGEANDGVVSTDDIERLLEFQVDVMQRMGTRVPEQIQTQLSRMLRANILKPSLNYYLEFMNSWKSGDYPGSFDNLHRYFDYTMHNRERRTFYQYALLNLAILQADFGCYRESILAMQETINTARENKDMACLNFSLSWLYHFHKAHPQDCPEIISARMELDTLHVLKTKAREGGMHHLHSMAYLSEAKQNLVTGESVPAAMECLLRSSHLNLVNHLHNAMGAHILLQSALWSRVGVTYLASQNCNLFLAKYKVMSPVEDVVKALCRLAYITAIRGRFEDALEKLDQVEHEALRSMKVYQYWASYVGLIKLKQAVHRNDLSAAQFLLQQLSTSPYVEPDCALEMSIARIDLHTRRGNLSTAMSLVVSLQEELERDKADINHRVRVMIMRAQILIACGTPMKGLSVIIEAANTAWRTRLMPDLFQAICTLSNILIHLEEFEAAHDIMDQIMPQALECEDAAFNAQCFTCLADAQMGMAGQTTGVARKEALHGALDFIDRAFGEYARLQDMPAQKAMMSRKSRIQNYLGEKSLRDDAVKMYRQLQKVTA